MKILLIMGALGMGAIFFTPKQKNISGTWVLETKEKNCEAAVLRIRMGEGIYQASLDIPGQQLYDKPVSIHLEKSKIKVILDKQQNCFIEAAVTDSTLEGKSFVNGKAETVKFRRVED